MKRVFYILLFFLVVACGPAKQIGYTYRPLSAEGCSVYYSSVNESGKLSIVVAVKSDRLVFNDEPVMMLKNFDGNILKLSGKKLDSHTASGGYVVNSVIIPISEVNALAQFPIKLTDVAFFKSGISKIRLSTIPFNHERTFSDDIIGYYLYDSFQQSYNQYNSF